MTAPKLIQGRSPVEFDDEIIEVLQAQKRFIASNKKLAGELYRDNKKYREKIAPK
ncbi:hypothetical protein [Paenibacillus sp. Soil766]|uniref:hypothetical protein n=1 Tax=Paenibacillus sp. Soil766 TaxID=1736404 RepID=UPI000A474AE8|nr:hypothetical protein [Paenibacillus sp. Soil766]